MDGGNESTVMRSESAEAADGTTLSSLTKAFSIVESLQEAGEATPTEVAERLELPPSTVHLYLKSLQANGYLVNDDGTYRVSLQFLEQGGRIRHSLDIYTVSKQELAELADATEMAVGFGVEERGLRVLVGKVERPEGVYDNPPLGQTTKMHWSSLGKAILSTLPVQQVDAIVDRHGLPRATEQTITTRQALADDLEAIRRRGFATEVEEWKPGLCAIAVPLETDGTDPDSAIAVSGPKQRVLRDQAELVDALKDARNVIKLRYDHY